MQDFTTASIVDKLWHEMRADLSRFAPDIIDAQVLMCCACGRRLPREDFDLEHLIPRQVLSKDPATVRLDPSTPANVRAGNLLLCKKPLYVKGQKLYGNGCNGWKGRFYDTKINKLVYGDPRNDRSAISEQMIIAALALGYLAMVKEFGIVVALMPSGRLMREQFFRPNRFHRLLDPRHQLLLSVEMPTSADVPLWKTPFSFTIENASCTVGMRNIGIILPVSRDPREQFAFHLRYAPQKYRFRPDFTTFLD